MPASTVYGHFDPTSLFAGDFPKMTRKVALPSGLNASGSPLEPGLLLGQVSIAGAFSTATAAKAGGNTGNGTIAMGSPATLANVQTGVYRVVFTAATAFQVYDPKGDEIGTGVNGTAFAVQVKLTTTAGGTAFVAGDEFDITVTQAAAALYTAASAANSGNTGNGALTLASPAYLPNAQAGVYAVEFTAPTAFEVSDPFGNPVGAGVVGTAFATQIGFTIAAGGTAFVGGDGFSITLSAVALFKPCVATATDGSQAPLAVLAQEVDTSGGAALAEAYFTGEFAYEEMTIDASWTLATLSQAMIPTGRDLYIRSVGSAA